VTQPGPARQLYRLDGVEVDPLAGRVSRDGRETYLRPKSLQVLVYLIEQRGRLVTKEELIERLWGGTAVTDDALVQCVVDIRRALGDDRHHPRFIKTFPKVGYHFIGPVSDFTAGDGIHANGHASLEVEEVTSVEIEVEEEDEPEGERQREREREKVTALTLAPPRSAALAHALLTPRRLLFATAVALAAAVGVALYLNSDARRPSAEVTLPQVPGRRAVAVMFFENQSGDGELDWLREGLADMVITGLSRSGSLTVLSRQQLHLLLERAGQSSAKKVRLDEALEVARRSRAETVVLGSFARLGGQVRLSVQLHDARDGRLIAADGLTAERPEQILERVDLLSLKLAARLGAAAAGGRGAARLAEVMTDNLEAYRYYSLALEQVRAYHTAEAIDLLKKAVALDPQFAMAYARIGYAYAMIRVGEAERARPFLEKAFQLAHRLTPKDRLYVAAWYAQPNGGEVIRAYREIVRQYPEETEAWWRLGLMLQYGGRSEEAIAALGQGLVMDPEAGELYNQLGNCYAGLGRYDEAVAAHQRYVALAPEESNAHDSLGMTYNEAGRYDEAVAALSRALALNPEFHFAHLHLGDSYFGQGRYRAAAEQYGRYLKLAPTGWDRAVGWQRLTRLYWRKGELGRAAACAEEARRGFDFGDAFFLALARGDAARAEGLKEKLFSAHPESNQPGATVSNPQAHYLRGYYALKSGRGEEAVTHFKRALDSPPVFFWYEDLGPDALLNAYVELGRWDEAVAEGERLLRLNPRWAWAQYRLGLAWERKGDRSRARAAYERFLQIWKGADADIPEVIAARGRLGVWR
jgi:eukaryotic-like serine/threonine-protein kinase